MHGRLRARPGPWALDGIPPDFNGQLLAPDMARFEPIMAGAIRRVPAMADARVSRVINGPEAFTPDNEFILGESEVGGFCVAAGFCAHGIAGAGGIGRQMASWIVDGEPELDLWKMDIRRFGPAVPVARLHAGPLDRELRDLLRHPLPERGAPGRPPLRVSPTYDELAASARSFGEKSGWERPNWFEPNADARGRREARAPAARLGGRALVAGDRRRGAGHAADGRAVRRDARSPSSRSSGPGARRSSSGCAPTTSTGRSGRSSTPSCSTGAAGSSAT